MRVEVRLGILPVDRIGRIQVGDGRRPLVLNDDARLGAIHRRRRIGLEHADGDDDREHPCDQTQMLEGNRQAIEDVDVGNVLEHRGSRRCGEILAGHRTELSRASHAQPLEPGARRLKAVAEGSQPERCRRGDGRGSYVAEESSNRGLRSQSNECCDRLARFHGDHLTRTENPVALVDEFDKVGARRHRPEGEPAGRVGLRADDIRPVATSRRRSHA